MARRLDPEIRICELIEELNGCNNQGHLGALIRLRKVLEQQKEVLNPNLKREVIRTLHVFISPASSEESVTSPAEAVRCLGTNVLWDRHQARWLEEQSPYFTSRTRLPVQEAITQVFKLQHQRRNFVKNMFRKVQLAAVED